MILKSGDSVRLITPDNPQLHGASGVIQELTSYGAVVRTPSAATGQYRATLSEMVRVASAGVPGFTGDLCETCQSVRMVRNGNCLLCLDCGSTSGCS